MTVAQPSSTTRSPRPFQNPASVLRLFTLILEGCVTLCPSYLPPLPAGAGLCFHILTNCFSRKPFVFKLICVAPGVPPQNHLAKERKMTQQTAKPSFINNSARCTYRFANGRRCRLSVSHVDSAFCPSHARLPENQREPSVPSLTADLKEFRSAIPINDFLARPLLLLAENKISPRRAAVLAYITNQLLRTLPAIDRELNPREDPNAPAEIIFDAPRPDRSEQPEPQPAYADVRT